MSGYYNRNNRGITKKLGPVTAYADAVLAGYKGTREQWAQDMAKLGQNVTQVAQNTELTTELAERTRENKEQVAKDTADVRRLADETKQAAAQAKEDAEHAEAAANNFRVDTTLTEAGKAAEAKVTGEKFAQLSEEIENVESELKETLSDVVGNNIVFEYNSFNLLGDYATNKRYNTDNQKIIDDEVSSLSIAEVKPETRYFYCLASSDSERQWCADTIFLDENMTYIDEDKNTLQLHSSGIVYFKLYTTPKNCAYVLQRSRTVDRPLTILFEPFTEFMGIANIGTAEMEQWVKPTVRIFNDEDLEIFKKTERIRTCVENERVYPSIYPDMAYDNEGNIIGNDNVTCITQILPICPNTTYKKAAVINGNGFNLEYDINKNLIKAYATDKANENWQCSFKTSEDTAYIAFCEKMVFFTDEGTTLFYFPIETKTVIVGDKTSETVEKRLEEYGEEMQNVLDNVNANFNYVVNLTGTGIQTAIDECVARGGGVVQLAPNASYKCTNTIHVYSDLVDIIGNGAKLDFSENQDAVGVHVRASGTIADLHENFRQQAMHKISGVYFIGSNRTNNFEGGRTGTAVLFQSDVSERPSMNFALEHCAIAGFQIGVDIQSQAWTNTLYCCDISACDIGVNHSYGHTNCGERNTLISCNIHTCSLAVSCSHWAGTIECIASSFDYNFKTFKLTDRGHIIATNCHIENTKDKDYFFDINNGDLIVKNSVFYCTQTTYGLIKVANYGRVVLKDNIQESWTMPEDTKVDSTVKYIVEWI